MVRKLEQKKTGTLKKWAKKCFQNSTSDPSRNDSKSGERCRKIALGDSAPDQIAARPDLQSDFYFIEVPVDPAVVFDARFHGHLAQPAAGAGRRPEEVATERQVSTVKRSAFQGHSEKGSFQSASLSATTRRVFSQQACSAPDEPLSIGRVQTGRCSSGNGRANRSRCSATASRLPRNCNGTARILAQS